MDTWDSEEDLLADSAVDADIEDIDEDALLSPDSESVQVEAYEADPAMIELNVNEDEENGLLGEIGEDEEALPPRPSVHSRLQMPVTPHDDTHEDEDDQNEDTTISGLEEGDIMLEEEQAEDEGSESGSDEDNNRTEKFKASNEGGRIRSTKSASIPDTLEINDEEEKGIQRFMDRAQSRGRHNRGRGRGGPFPRGGGRFRGHNMGQMRLGPPRMQWPGPNMPRGRPGNFAGMRQPFNNSNMMGNHQMNALGAAIGSMLHNVHQMNRPHIQVTRPNIPGSPQFRNMFPGPANSPQQPQNNTFFVENRPIAQATSQGCMQNMSQTQMIPTIGGMGQSQQMVRNQSSQRPTRPQQQPSRFQQPRMQNKVPPLMQMQRPPIMQNQRPQQMPNQRSPLLNQNTQNQGDQQRSVNPRFNSQQKKGISLSAIRQRANAKAKQAKHIALQQQNNNTGAGTGKRPGGADTAPVIPEKQAKLAAASLPEDASEEEKDRELARKLEQQKKERERIVAARALRRQSLAAAKKVELELKREKEMLAKQKEEWEKPQPIQSLASRTSLMVQPALQDQDTAHRQVSPRFGRPNQAAVNKTMQQQPTGFNRLMRPRQQMHQQTSQNKNMQIQRTINVQQPQPNQAQQHISPQQQSAAERSPVNANGKNKTKVKISRAEFELWQRTGKVPEAVATARAQKRKTAQLMQNNPAMQQQPIQPQQQQPIQPPQLQPPQHIQQQAMGNQQQQAMMMPQQQRFSPPAMRSNFASNSQHSMNMQQPITANPNQQTAQFNQPPPNFPHGQTSMAQPSLNSSMAPQPMSRFPIMSLNNVTRPPPSIINQQVQPQGGLGDEAAALSDMVVFSRLNQNTTRDKLMGLCSRMGQVLDIQMNPSNMMAVVKYSNKMSALQCIRAYNNKVIDMSAVGVDFAF